jgi:4-hydroxythreonine-4-phosphate dehydrogenase
MLMDNGEMTILLLTGHIPLRDIAATLTQELVESSIRLALSDLKSRFELKKPRIAVAGLNPHAGEIVTNSEESAVFTPVLDRLRGEGIDIEGPFAADSLFPMARGGRWDLIVSGYHDQGLIAAKYPGLDKVVNITLGLPYTRVSPGHGTAYDIAGLGRADPRSFERALKIAFSGRIRGL